MGIFNDRMNYIKEVKNLTAKEMANRIKIPLSTMTYYFKDREPKYDVLIRIAKEFNVSVNWLIGFYDDDKEELVKENQILREQLKEIKSIIERGIV